MTRAQEAEENYVIKRELAVVRQQCSSAAEDLQKAQSTIRQLQEQQVPGRWAGPRARPRPVPGCLQSSGAPGPSQPCLSPWPSWSFLGDRAPRVSPSPTPGGILWFPFPTHHWGIQPTRLLH